MKDALSPKFALKILADTTRLVNAHNKVFQYKFRKISDLTLNHMKKTLESEIEILSSLVDVCIDQENQSKNANLTF